MFFSLAKWKQGNVQDWKHNYHNFCQKQEKQQNFETGSR